jgi:plasmid stabilization system protein ParE
MTLEFHPAVQQDFNAAIDYYAAKGGGHLADRFETELRDCLAAIRSGPRHFAFYQGSTVFRRIRLRSFPYLVVYRERPDMVRVSILKHEKRHPRFGMKRW